MEREEEEQQEFLNLRLHQMVDIGKGTGAKTILGHEAQELTSMSDGQFHWGPPG